VASLAANVSLTIQEFEVRTAASQISFDWKIAAVPIGST
jgi:hypothetical protein